MGIRGPVKGSFIRGGGGRGRFLNAYVVIVGALCRSWGFLFYRFKSGFTAFKAAVGPGSPVLI